jgi:hypothetical protein
MRSRAFMAVEMTKAIADRCELSAHWGAVGAGSEMPVAVAEQVSAVADRAAGSRLKRRILR